MLPIFLSTYFQMTIPSKTSRFDHTCRHPNINRLKGSRSRFRPPRVQSREDLIQTWEQGRIEVQSDAMVRLEWICKQPQTDYGREFEEHRMKCMSYQHLKNYNLLSSVFFFRWFFCNSKQIQILNWRKILAELDRKIADLGQDFAPVSLFLQDFCLKFPKILS